MMPSKIEWTGESWNPIRAAYGEGFVGWHCEHASPGCQNCYAETQNVAQRFNLGTGLPYKPGHRKDVEIYIDEAALVKPLSWKKGRKVFVCSMTDLFADFVTDAMIDRIFAVMALCPQHTFQVLTKRSGRMREYFRETTGWRARNAELLNELKPSPLWNGNVYQGWQNLHGRPDGLPNVWLGVSIEDQQRAGERIPDLLATPAAVRWISAEPLLGPVNLRRLRITPVDDKIVDALEGYTIVRAFERGQDRRKIDWVVIGGESGSKARPMHPDWPRALRDQCAAAGVPFFFKQWGEWELSLDRDRDDPDWRADYSNDYADRGKSKWLNLAGGCGFHGERFVVMRKVGKKHAGRLLDGVKHNGMPG